MEPAVQATFPESELISTLHGLALLPPADVVSARPHLRRPPNVGRYSPQTQTHINTPIQGLETRCTWLMMTVGDGKI